MKKQKRKNGAFTLLEVIIVIIIVGVLASLALPKLFSTVEFSRSNEALNTIAVARGVIEQCYLITNGSYTNCTTFGTQLNMNDPGAEPGAHFGYSISANGSVGYTITATRNTLNGGDGSSTVFVTVASSGITKGGTGEFSSIQ